MHYQKHERDKMKEVSQQKVFHRLYCSLGQRGNAPTHFRLCGQWFECGKWWRKPFRSFWGNCNYVQTLNKWSNQRTKFEVVQAVGENWQFPRYLARYVPFVVLEEEFWPYNQNTSVWLGFYSALAYWKQQHSFHRLGWVNELSTKPDWTNQEWNMSCSFKIDWCWSENCETWTQQRSLLFECSDQKIIQNLLQIFDGVPT